MTRVKVTGVSGWKIRPAARDGAGGPDRTRGTRASRPQVETDWPDSVRVVGSQPSLWWNEPDLAPEPGRRTVAVGGRPVRAAAAIATGPTMVEELGQSFYLMGLMALVLSLFVGLGLLAVRVLV